MTKPGTEEASEDGLPAVLAQRPIELLFRPVAFAPIQDDPTTIFDDKTVVVEASRRGEVRGSGLPLLIDLARKDRFLHDSSVTGLGLLIDPARGPNAPHAFFITDSTQRDQLVDVPEESLKQIRGEALIRTPQLQVRPPPQQGREAPLAL